MTDFDQNKNSDAEHKAAIRKSAGRCLSPGL